MKSDPQLLGDQLSDELVKGLGPKSRWALRTAIEAAQTDGIGGMLVINIPTRSKDYLDVAFVAGSCEIVSKWGSAA